jgi:porin
LGRTARRIRQEGRRVRSRSADDSAGRHEWRSTGGNFWGNTEYTLNADTQKLGLWPGGFFKFQANTGFGSNAFQDSGAIVPINTAALFPGNDVRTTALTNATFMQFLSTKFGIEAGKINTVDSGQTEFYGDYRTQFLNAAFNFPMTLEQIPLSTFGGGVIALPREDIVLSAFALGASGSPTDNDPGKAFSQGVQVLGNGQLTITPFGLVGHQSVGFSWNNVERFSLTQDPSNLARLLLNETVPRLANPGPVLTDILTRFFPALSVPTQPANRESSSWTFTYAFDQYFWRPDDDPKHGIGMFFAFGASDGNPNPIQYSFIAGIGGKGVVPHRPDDSFGLGVGRTQFSSAFVPFLRQQLNLGLQHEDAVEMYYNASLTSWLNLTADLQIVDPGLTRRLGTPLQLTAVDTAVVAGARVRVRF